jgi:predicted GNAT family acetyltransferase
MGYNEPESIQRARLEVHASLGLVQHLPLRRYLARLQGEPVAMAALFLAAGVAGIYEVATAPHARRMGIGTATVLAPLREAWGLGYRASVLASSPMGCSLYRRLGFREYGTFHLYVREVWEA